MANNVMLKIKSKIYRKYIFKIELEHIQAFSLKVYILALSLFPEKKISQNRHLSLFVINNILKIPCEEEESINDEEVETLNNALMKNEWAIKTITNYYLLRTFYYSSLLKFKSETIKENFDKAFNQAKLYNKDSKLLVPKDLTELKKKIKKDIKIFKKEIKQLISEKIEIEQFKEIKPIKISLTNALYFVTFYSFVWLFGGIAYNWIFLSYFFDINISDFFELADYASSNMDILLAGFILTIVSVWIIFLGQKDGLRNDIISKQCNTPKTKQYNKLTLLFVLFLISIVQYYARGNTIVFWVFIYIVIMSFFGSFSHHIENKISAYQVLLLAIIFLSYVILTAIDDASKVKDGIYVSPYNIVLEDKYKSFSNHIFVKSNSKYVFLLDKNHKMTAIKKINIKAFLAK